MAKERRAELRRHAEQAEKLAPSPWNTIEEFWKYWVVDKWGGQVCGAGGPTTEFIAACDPATVLALLTALDAAEADSRRLDALEAAFASFWQPSLVRIEGGVRISDGDYPQAAASKGAAAVTVRELADKLLEAKQ